MTTSKHDPVSEAVKAAQDEVVRMREQWDTFGDPCGKSRWFAATPKVKLDVSGQVVWRCPVAGCGGEMKYTGVDWPTGVPGHHHQCDSCGFTAAIKGAIFGDQTDD